MKHLRTGGHQQVRRGKEAEEEGEGGRGEEETERRGKEEKEETFVLAMAS